MLQEIVGKPSSSFTFWAMDLIVLRNYHGKSECAEGSKVHGEQVSIGTHIVCCLLQAWG
jgi:hypothetical protein